MFRALLLFVFPAVLAGQIHATAVADAMTKMRKATDKAICQEMRNTDKECATVIESATQNALTGGDSLWGFSYSLRNQGVRSAKDSAAFKAALQSLNAGPLELEKNRIAAINYFREHQGKLAPISPEDFHRLALNPTSGVVARLDPAFLAAGGEIAYQAPDSWTKDGAPAGSSGTLQLNVKHPTAAHLNLEIVNLDDQKLATVTVTNCRMKVAAAEAACNPADVNLPAGIPVSLSLEIKLARNLKTEQPAFKLVAKTPASQAAVLNLAIPYKPRPNYFLFGVTGFLFGGLIAVMVIIGRRNKGVPPV